jgi:hypothetical protein
LLLYNVYAKGSWKNLTRYLLHGLSHNDVVVNVSLDSGGALRKRIVERFFSDIKGVDQVFYTQNNPAIGEAAGFDNLRKRVDLSDYEIVTYIHSKGVTKPHNQYISDWVELMRYFVLERHDLCVDAFRQGYALYGVNIGVYRPGAERYGPYQFSDFHFSGNFVSVNLNLLREKFLSTPCDQDYFGVEGFWGKLCTPEQAYSPHNSFPRVNSHYEEPYPDHLYKKPEIVSGIGAR